MKYRAEIDGLRALAVIPVILFHAGFEQLSGGFVGVDVFFVISGYLITTILIEDIEKKKFSIIKFYQRRARRILPALSLVCFTTLPFSFYLLDPESFTDYGKSLTSVSLFLSNVYFALTGGYFAEYVTAKPLLHTWSLSVEEQFYIAFPLVLLFWSRFPQIKLKLIIASLSIASFICAIILIEIHPRIAFFSLPTRAWELGVGALLATTQISWQNRSSLHGNLFGLFGSGMLVASYFIIDADNRIPSIGVILPVLGTALIILAPSSSVSSRLLASRPLVFVGLISYSLYLWHQPVLSFGHLISDSVSVTVLLLLMIIALSFLTWKYIETPFRNKKFLQDPYTLPLSIFTLTLIGFIGFFVSSNHGFSERFPYYTNYKLKHAWGAENNADESCIKRYGNDKYCLLTNPNSDVTDILIGDSHANHFYYGLSERLSLDGRNLLMIGAGGCPPLIDIDMGYNYKHGTRLRCLARVNSQYLELLSSESVQHVYIAFAQETMFDEKLDFIDMRGEIDFSLDRQNAVLQGILRTVRYAQVNGKSVSLLLDLPDNTHLDFLQCLLKGKSEDVCINVWKLEKVSAKYIQLVTSLKAFNIDIIDTSFALQMFPFTDEGAYLYRDGTHISLKGSRFIGLNIQIPTERSSRQ